MSADLDLPLGRPDDPSPFTASRCPHNVVRPIPRPGSPVRLPGRLDQTGTVMSAYSEALAPGTIIADLEVRRTLGVGGFGITYLARDLQLDQMVAMKEYLPRWSGTRLPDGRVGPRDGSVVADFDRGLRKFRQEARALAKLNHPLIVRVYRVFPRRGTAYMVMEFIEGRSLREELKAVGTLDEVRVRDLLANLTEGLTKVHEADLLHRDIKSANVMIRADGSPVLIDFGAARYRASEHSQASLIQVLTHGFAALEQYGSAGVQGPWTDIYALAALAYEALSGVVPARATNRVRNDPVAPLRRVAPGVSEAMAAAVDGALAVYAEDRPQSVAEWRRMLAETESLPRSHAHSEARRPREEQAAPRDHSQVPRRRRGLSVLLQRLAVALGLGNGNPREGTDGVRHPPCAELGLRLVSTGYQPGAPAIDVRVQAAGHTSSDGGFVIGCHPDLADHVVNHEAVSWRHLRVIAEGDRFFIEDLNSRHGTRLNGAQLPPFSLEEITPDCLIELGGALPLAVYATHRRRQMGESRTLASRIASRRGGTTR